MKIDPEEGKKLGAAFAGLAENAAPGPDCPRPERIHEAVMGELPSGEIRRLVDHTASCAACAESWRLARAMAEHLAVSGRPLVVAMVPRWRRIAAPLALAASLLLLSIVGYRLMNAAPKTRPPALRNGASGAIRSLLPRDQTLSRESCLLRWELEKPVEGARFQVQVTTQDVFRVIAAGRDLAQGEFLIEEDRLADLPAGSILLWWVRASLPDGRQQRSKTFTHRLE